MKILLLVALLSQAPSERDPLTTIESRVLSEIKMATPVLEQLVREGKQEPLLAELARLDKKHERRGDVDAKMVFMSRILSAIATEDGGARSLWIREGCEPYAVVVASKQLKIPAHSELLESQLMSFHNILAETKYSHGRDKLEKDEMLRVSRVKMVTGIWIQIVESQLAISREYSDEFVESVVSGDEVLRMPPLPKSIPPFSITAGQSSETIRDPKIKQDYVDYLKQCQDTRFRFSQAASLYELRRGRYLRMTRLYLERLYGADRRTWDELRKIVNESVEDKGLSQQVLKDLTRKKNP